MLSPINMIVSVAYAIGTGVNAVVLYKVLRLQPPAATSAPILHSVIAAEHKVCDFCGFVVARYEAVENGKIKCANCKVEGK